MWVAVAFFVVQLFVVFSEEIIGEHPDDGHPYQKARGERVSGSKYVVDV